MKNVQSNLPGVSCVCITYKRTDFLEEAIESFLRQDYSGKKELIIINDDNEQTLIFEHPEVKIYNFKDRFNSIGEKRNKSIEFSSYNLIMLWDDDDICLPNKITFGVNKMLKNNLEFYNLNQAFYYSMSEKIIDLVSNSLHANSCYTKNIFKEVKGYDNINIAEDLKFQEKVLKTKKPILIENFIKNDNIKKEDTTYFYRWGGVSYHLSLVEKEKNQLEKVKEERLKQDPKKGIINLNPNWKEDYVEMAKSYFQKI